MTCLKYIIFIITVIWESCIAKTIWITIFKEYCTKWRGTKEPLDESEKGE